MKRRDFLQKAGLGMMVLSTGQFPFSASIEDPNLERLTILHTNDVHSRIDPFPMDGSRNQGMGGAARRAAMITKLRREHEHTLLLDCGDIFQGTPYYNFFGGELEFKLMSKMKYDAATLGNHDFDGGIEGLHKQLKHASFPFIISNYQMNNTLMAGKTLPFKVFDKGDLKIGVFGLGIELNGLVPKKLYGDTVYQDPVVVAQQMATLLKHDLKCDYVICLSHLGYDYKEQQVSDVYLAQMTRDIDLILGGHTHTFMKKPDVRRNIDAKEVVINQAGWAGIMLGKIEVVFEKRTGKKCVTCKNTYLN